MVKILAAFGPSSLEDDLRNSDPAYWPSVYQRWRGGAPKAAPPVELPPRYYRAFPGDEAPYALLITGSCPPGLVERSWSIETCVGPCDVPRSSGSLRHNFFFLRRGGEWLLYFDH